MNNKLLSIFALATEIGIPVRTLRTMVLNHRIPYLKPGKRTLLFSAEKVLLALNKFEIKAAAEPRR